MIKKHVRTENMYMLRESEENAQERPQLKQVCISWEDFVSRAIATGIENTKAFKAGRIRQHFKFWQSLT